MRVIDNILSLACETTSTFIDSRAKSERKAFGQFFTSMKTAEFMASLFLIDFDKPSLSILDAGAGTGILSAALVQRIREQGYTGTISIVCYENDVRVLPVLSENMEMLKRVSDIKYQIRIDNYILSQSDKLSGLFGKIEQFDIIIGNPPYLKVSKKAEEAKALPEVCYGAPNLYFLFWAMGIYNLKTDGELVYIIPRSWTSGAYFEKFRNFLFKNCVITDIHLFGSRDRVFDGESVLQETMIIKVRKTTNKPHFVKMTYSSTSDFTDLTHYDVNYNTVVAPNRYVYLVTSEEEASILARVNKQSHTLVSDNLRMRTGIIVDFRTREVLRSKAERGAYPLFYSHHIQDGRISWPIGHENEYIVTSKTGYLQENTDYVFVKRFTAKEEKRRLQCGIYLNTDFSDFRFISTQNKINYIKCDNPEFAYGIFVILNSTLYDKYYRILNGSTQVNSTEINSMPVPSREDIRKMGLELMGKELTEFNCDKIIDKWIV